MAKKENVRKKLIENSIADETNAVESLWPAEWEKTLSHFDEEIGGQDVRMFYTLPLAEDRHFPLQIICSDLG